MDDKWDKVSDWADSVQEVFVKWIFLVDTYDNTKYVAWWKERGGIDKPFSKMTDDEAKEALKLMKQFEQEHATN